MINRCSKDILVNSIHVYHTNLKSLISKILKLNIQFVQVLVALNIIAKINPYRLCINFEESFLSYLLLDAQTN